MPPRRRISTFDWSTGVIAVAALTAGVTVYLREGQDRFFAISSATWV